MKRETAACRPTPRFPVLFSSSDCVLREQPGNMLLLRLLGCFPIFCGVPQWLCARRLEGGILPLACPRYTQCAHTPSRVPVPHLSSVIMCSFFLFQFRAFLVWLNAAEPRRRGSPDCTSFPCRTCCSAVVLPVLPFCSVFSVPAIPSLRVLLFLPSLARSLSKPPLLSCRLACH